MNFWDTVYELRKSGDIPRIWKRSDIRPHLLLDNFSENTIRTVPSNASISLSHKGIGDYVKAGQTPKAWRIGSTGSGEFQLIVDPEDDKATQDSELWKARQRAIDLRSSPAARKLREELRSKMSESAQGTKRLRHIRPLDPAILIEEREFRISGPRSDISHKFARWATMSALRSGAPVKSQEAVDSALGVIKLNRLFDKGYGPIDKGEFAEWHREAIDEILKLRFPPTKGTNEPRKLNVGWAAKIIAVYLKTSCYLAGFGRDGLSRVIHPPIDNDLVKSLKKQFHSESDIMHGLNRFNAIGSMDFDDYEAIIQSCELIAAMDGYTLFEVELYW